MSDIPTRELVVTKLEGPVAQGTSNGKEWKIWNVTATTAGGAPIDLKLNTFNGDLPLNTPIIVTVKKRENAQYGDSYTIALPGKKSGGGSTQQTTSPAPAADKRIESLEHRVTAIEQRLGMALP